MEENPEDDELNQLLDQIGEASQFMADMADMYNDSLEYYLNRVIGLDDMEGMEGMDGMGGSDDDDEDDMDEQPKGKKGKGAAGMSAKEAQAKKDCKQQ